MRSSDILIVDDEVGIRDLLSEILQDEGYSVALAENAEEARQLRHQVRPAMVLLDIWMPDCDGITLLKEWAKNGQLNMPVVMMSGHASIDTAVEATKIGALDFLEKPITLQKLLSTVDRALKHGEMQAASGLSLDKLGNSPVIQDLNHKLEAAAKQSGPVLLSGEVGSPFELVARHLRKNGTPWVEPAKVEHIVDTPLELLQKATGGVLYVGDIAQYSKNIQNGIVFLLGKADRYNVRIIAANSRSNEETAVQDGRLSPCRRCAVSRTILLFWSTKSLPSWPTPKKSNRSNSAAAHWPCCASTNGRVISTNCAALSRVWHWGRTAAKWKSRKSARLWAGLRNRFLPKSSAVSISICRCANCAKNWNDVILNTTSCRKARI